MKIDFLKDFARTIFPLIQYKFILLTHNGFFPAPKPDDQYSRKMLDDDLLVRWYAKNPAFFHPKLIAIPVGIPNRGVKEFNTEAMEEPLR